MNDSAAISVCRALTIFEEVCELDGGARATALDEACAGDAALRAAVERLLAADAATDSPLDRLPDLVTRPEIPGYELLEPIGRGGMGTVHAARRAGADFEQRVAIKLLQTQLADARAVQRFQRERAILARLNHPNIASLIDGGTTANGQPYLVMELVAGDNIVEHCDGAGLDLDQRLALFGQVCAAVHHAHRHLVVHRDIKPGNVLVTAEGHVKLLDFGIAGLLSDAGASAESTRAMTPGYASPEQVRGEPVTTASDVYALGVLLYRLVAGVAPYQVDELSPAAVERAVCEAPIPLPSQRCPEPTRARRLRGDLDTIIARAMHRVPERRYAGAAQLAEDLERYRRQLPIAARADGAGYRLLRMVQRHRLASALAGSLVLALMLFAATMSWQVRQTRIALAAATQERAAAGQVVDFLVGLFELADPTGRRLESITVREMLDRGADQAAHSAPDAPYLRSRLLSAMARVYVNLGDYRRALSLVDGADPALLDDAGRAQLGSVRALALRGTGDIEGARAVMTEAVAAASSDLGPASPTTLQYRFHQATLERDAGSYATARDALAELLPLQEAVLGRDHPDVARTRQQLATAHWLTGDTARAAELYRAALDIQRRVLPDGHPHVASSLAGLAILAHRAGDYAQAIELGSEALAIQQAAYGELHPYVASTSANIGAVLLDAGDLEAARQQLTEALTIQQAIHDGPVPTVASTLNNLGLVELRSGNYPAAESWFRQALQVAEAVYGQRHPQLASSLDNLGLALLRQGDLDGAQLLFQESLSQRETLLGPAHPDTAWSLDHLGELMAARGKTEDAAATYRRALGIRQTTLGDDHELSVATREALAKLCDSAPPACIAQADGADE